MAVLIDNCVRYLDSISTLPMAPTLVNELLAVFREPDKEIDEVVSLISYEPVLTAEILKRCNSAYFAGQEPARDIFESVSRLGFYEVYCLVLAMFGAGTKTMKGVGAGLDVEEFWRHSVTTAVAASVISDKTGESKPLAFTAGLLHDMGKLVLASVEGERYSAAVEQSRSQVRSIIEVEREAFGTDHAELGGQLMARWNLPSEVVSSVAYHHQPGNAGSFEPLSALVGLADLMNPDASSEAAAGAATPNPAVPLLHTLRIQPAAFGLLMRQTRTNLERVKNLFQI